MKLRKLKLATLCRMHVNGPDRGGFLSVGYVRNRPHHFGPANYSGIGRIERFSLCINHHNSHRRSANAISSS